MANTAFRLFISSIFTLAKTMVIKHEQIAVTINHNLIAKGYVVDWENPASWRYYMNLAGEYHQADFDEISQINPDSNPYLTIKVASNTGAIDANFTKALIDTVTGDVSLANEYVFGKPFYNSLINKYPEQAALINGILNPVNIADALTANDGDLLYCGNYYKRKITDALGTRYSFQKRDTPGLDDPLLIEDHEVDLLPDLEKWIKAFLGRWFLQDFCLIDDLYLHTILGILFSNVPNFVFNHRLAKCKTEQAHSFHIKSYLESHGKLARYADALPLKQLLFLYRNIAWIEKNAGKEETFRLMVDNLATPCDIPLTGYKLKHSLANQPENLLPDVLLQRDVINFVQTGSAFTTVSVARMLSKEIGLAKENHKDLDSVKREIETAVKISWDSELPTKIIESDMIDNTLRLPYKLEDVLFNHWIYTATQGTYTGNIFVSNPKTGDRLLLTPLNALILAIYCLNKGYNNVSLQYVPVIEAHNIPRVGPFSYSTLKEKVESSRITDQKITDLIGSNPVPYTFTSSESFYSGCVDMHNEFMRRYRRLAKEANFISKAQLERIMGKLYYLRKECNMQPSGTLYNTWLASNGFVLDNFTSADFVSLGTNLVIAATNNEVNTTKKLASLQQAILEIMKQFSSYSVQYIYSINPANTLLLNVKSIKTDNQLSKARAKAILPLNLTNVSNIKFRPHSVNFSLEIVPSVLN